VKPERRYLAHRSRQGRARARQAEGSPDSAILKGPRPGAPLVLYSLALASLLGSWALIGGGAASSDSQSSETHSDSLEPPAERPPLSDELKGGQQEGPQASGQESGQEDQRAEGEGAVSAERALSWRLSQAQLAEDGLAACAPPGWIAHRRSAHGATPAAELEWRPAHEPLGALSAQSLSYHDGELRLLSVFKPEALELKGALMRLLIAHHRLASCALGPQSELHDPWFSKTWSAQRWRSSKGLAQLDRWFQISTRGALHSTVGLARFGLPELQLESEAEEGRELLRALTRAWMLGQLDELEGTLGRWELTALESERSARRWRTSEARALKPSPRDLKRAAARSLERWSRVERELRGAAAPANDAPSRAERAPRRPKAKPKRSQRPRPRPKSKKRQQRREPRLKLQYD